VSPCHHCCRRKALSITHSECAFVALDIQYAMHMHHIVVCDPSPRLKSYSCILYMPRQHRDSSVYLLSIPDHKLRISPVRHFLHSPVISYLLSRTYVTTKGRSVCCNYMTHTHTHTHTHVCVYIYIYIYIYMCVCVYV
jgi:hypothetical protein